MKALLISVYILFMACTTPIQVNRQPKSIEHTITVDVLGYKQMMEKLDRIEAELEEIKKALKSPGEQEPGPDL